MIAISHSFLVHHPFSSLSGFLLSVPAFFLYAEIHYKFRGIYSRLRHSFPEILADAPYRVEPGKKIPLLILVKDAHQFPIELIRIEADARRGQSQIFHKNLLTKPLVIHLPFWYKVIELDAPPGISGTIDLQVAFTVKRKGKTSHFFNDNYIGTSHAPLRIRLSPHPLPTLPGLFYGDLHVHSNYTNDQVEFGAPPPTIQKAANAMGLSFVAITDHSYDMDDYPDNYLKNDPRQQKWNQFQKEVAGLNSQPNGKQTLLIAGEEVSARNNRGRTIHFLILNDPTFYKGTGDGAEKWFIGTRSENSIPEIMEKLPDSAVAVAAHPATPIPRLEYLLLNRGKWEKPDSTHPRLSGFQVLNGEVDDGFRDGLKLWKWSLSRGEHKYIYAGTDAHGNFNRFRQIGIPFFKMTEMENQILGEKRTGVFLDHLSLSNIIKALKSGNCFITDGPALQLFAKNADQMTVQMGNIISGTAFELSARMVSSPEFGKFQKIRLLLGRIKKADDKIRETSLRFRQTETSEFDVTIFRKLVLKEPEAYLRIEVQTVNGKIAYSNPIWLQKK